MNYKLLTQIQWDKVRRARVILNDGTKVSLKASEGHPITLREHPDGPSDALVYLTIEDGDDPDKTQIPLIPAGSIATLMVTQDDDEAE